MRSSPSTPEAFRRVLEADRGEIHTALPGRVRSYDANAQTAEIVLEVRQVRPGADDDDPDDVGEYPILPSVPVLCLRGGGFFAHFPLAEGDKVLVLFSESDLNEWRRTGRTADPGIATRHGLSGAVCIPGIHWRGNPLASADVGDEPRLTIGREGGAQIQISEAQINVGGSAPLAVGADVKAHLQAIAASLDTIATAAGAVNSYVYATQILADPIDTSIARGA